MFRRQAKRTAGVTLIEMMVVVAILAILVALAAPNLSELLIRNRLESASNELIAALSLARSESIRRGEIVVLRRAAGSASQEWTKGWEMFVDPSGNRIRDSGEELLRVGVPVTQPLTLYGSRANLNDFIAFAPSGRVAGGANIYIFVLCHGDQVAVGGQSRSRAVLINDSGRIRQAAANDSGQPVKEDTGTGSSPITSCTSP